MMDVFLKIDVMADGRLCVRTISYWMELAF